jgi:hypothetical protein
VLPFIRRQVELQIISEHALGRVVAQGRGAVYALHVGNHSTELMALDNLRANIRVPRMPILPALLGARAAKHHQHAGLQCDPARLHVGLEERYEVVEDVIIQVRCTRCLASF